MRVTAVSNKRKFQRFNKFRGVDYSSSPLEVKTNRATDMANLILRDGTLHKRNGFEQFLYLGGAENIIGAWLFKRWAVWYEGDDYKEGLCEFLIYIQGKDVYECNITKGFKPNLLYSNADISSKATAFESSVIKGGVRERRLYIACGEYLVYKPTSGDDWSVYNILELSNSQQQDIVYIPTTTINITATDTAYTEKQKTLFEPINILSNWRKNRLVYEKIDGGVMEYMLDGAVDYDTDAMPYITFGEDSYRFQLVTGSVGNRKFETMQEWNGERISIVGKRIFIPYEALLSSAEDTEDLYYELTFPCRDVETIHKIGSIGAIFGNDGRADRLFIADENLVRYSENTAEYLPDFTYFPATNFVKCGQSGEITAFMRVSNGTLAAFKDVEQKQEPSVYYISGKYTEVGTDDTGTTLYDDTFNVTAGNIEEGCPSPNAIASLAGDSLFVSKTGVYGIQLSENVAVNDRYAKLRSRLINTKLTKFDLSNAQAAVYDNRYYLAVGGKNNEVYVADARYSFTLEGDEANTFNYEWFRWTDIPVATWIVKENELWFISTDKYLCRFTNNYYDKYLTENGETVHDDETVEEGKVYFDKALLPIVKNALYAEYGDERWDVVNVTDYGSVDSPMWAFDAPEGRANGIVNLAFICPIKAYWKSAVTDFGSSVHKKNMYSISVVVAPAEQSVVSVGYTTRLQNRFAITAEGTNSFDFEDLSFDSYGEMDGFYQMFSFDAGGFISAYRQRVFERNFVYAQMKFACNSIGDCIVEEIMVEYVHTIKNIGVG